MRNAFASVARTGFARLPVNYQRPRAEELQGLATQGHLISGASLVAIADGVDQVIDGEFLGYEQGDAAPTLVLRAVDSSSWDITSNSEALLDMFWKKYKVVIEAGAVSG